MAASLVVATMVEQAATDPSPKIELAGEVIRRFREKAGLSLSQLAERAGIEKSSLSKYENNQLAMSLPIVERIAEGLKTPPLLVIFECLKQRYPDLRRGKSKVATLVGQLVSELSKS